MQSVDTDLTMQAIDITHSCVIQLPRELSITFEAGDAAPLWVVPFNKMPYGLDTVSGQVVVCAHGTDFKYKAWRFIDADKLQYGAWQKAPDFVPTSLPVLKIRSTGYCGNNYSTWSSAYEDAWQSKGVLSHYKMDWGEYHKTAEEDISFMRFMELNYWDLFSLLDPIDPA